jgi:CheY-like chemotaxis protein
VLRVAAYDTLADTSADAATALAALAVAGRAHPPAVAAPLTAAPVDAPQPPAPSCTEAPAPAASGPAPPSGDGDRRRRVLVVEDSPTIVQVVKYFLENEGFDVVMAGDGQEGLALALQDPPDIVVSDFNMPQMTGPEMIRLLRADPRTADVRVLMLTSESSVECETEGLAAGADDYILKPVEPRRLAARVKALLGRSRPRAA